MWRQRIVGLVVLGVMAVMGASLASTQARVTLTGRAFAEDGSVLPGAVVVLLRQGDVIAEAITGPDGRFVFPGIEPGPYLVRAQLPGFAAEERAVTVLTSQSAVIEIRFGDRTGAPRPPVIPPAPAPSMPTVPPPPAVVVPPPPPPDASDGPVLVPVFYATDRARSGRPGEFANQRSDDGSLTLGRVTVSVPPGHRIGEVERPWWWTWRREDPDRFFLITERTEDGDDEYYGRLAAHVKRSPGREAFVFVHGYNVGFDDAVFRAAQIAHDLSFAGAPIVYSWPSRNALIAYPYDSTAADQTVGQLRTFLSDLAARSGAETIHLIGHSMGNLPLTKAVAAMPSGALVRPFKHLILTAPDIDAVVFRDQIAPALTRVGPRITLYASSEDSALKAARIFHGARRAGDSRNVLIVNGVETIDASHVVTDLLGHSPFVPSVLMDIHALITTGWPPAKRFGMRGIPAGAPRYFEFRPTAP